MSNYYFVLNVRLTMLEVIFSAINGIPVSIFGFDCFDDFYFSICTTLKQGSLIPECIERLWLISQAYGFMPALFKSSCKAASRIGVVSGGNQNYFDNSWSLQ
jgi:hypothetical protein